MGEAWPSPTPKIWGCNDSGGWVPYPKDIPRRNPIVDAVGRIDDPCARPAHDPPTFAPMPKFKPPLEGYPNHICKMDESARNGGDGDNEDPSLKITIAPGTNHEICITPEPILQTPTVYANPPTIEDCCSDARSLTTLKNEVQKILGPHEELEMGMKKWAQCQTVCQPLLPKYPCRGVIRSPRGDWLKLPEEQRCKPSMISTKGQNDENSKALTGREFTEGLHTSDLYTTQADLPKRFDNPEWFKGYGCEKLAHPFYLTTSMDYGRFPPTAHTMTQFYYPRQSKFTTALGKGGMPRNRSLNLANDKTFV